MAVVKDHSENHAPVKTQPLYGHYCGEEWNAVLSSSYDMHDEHSSTLACFPPKEYQLQTTDDNEIDQLLEKYALSQQAVVCQPLLSWQAPDKQAILDEIVAECEQLFSATVSSPSSSATAGDSLCTSAETSPEPEIEIEIWRRAERCCGGGAAAAAEDAEAKLRRKRERNRLAAQRYRLRRQQGLIQGKTTLNQSKRGSYRKRQGSADIESTQTEPTA